eukprot:3285752-Rhodomonas_salina.2
MLVLAPPLLGLRERRKLRQHLAGLDADLFHRLAAALASHCPRQLRASFVPPEEAAGARVAPPPLTHPLDRDPRHACPHRSLAHRLARSSTRARLEAGGKRRWQKGRRQAPCPRAGTAARPAGNTRGAAAAAP